MNPPVSRRRIAATVVALSGTLVLSAAQPPQQKPPEPQRPVFRAGTYFVTVDVYPLRGGRVLDDLTAADFEVLEDGRPQKVESFEYVRIARAAPDAELRDPDNQGDMLQRLADPRSRVFVLFLDSYHLDFFGAARLRAPIIRTIDSMLAPTDLFAVMTPFIDAHRLAFGRRTVTVEDDIRREWPVDVVDKKSLDVEEQKLTDCYLGTNVPVGQIIAKRREDRSLTSLEELVAYLAAVREGRKTVFVFTHGWSLPRRSQEFLNALADEGPVPAPPLGITSTGKLRLGTRLEDGTRFACDQEVRRVAELDNEARFRDLLHSAANANVAFYPINPIGVGAPLRLTQQMQSLASETNGVAVANTNDLDGAMSRLSDGLSSYYLLGYSSTNTNFDGRQRRISVKVARPGIDVKARPGYRAPSAEELAALRNPGPSVPSSTAATETGIANALATLARLRSSDPVHAYGRAHGREVVVVTEISGSELAAGRWKEGGEVEVRIAGTDGELAGIGRGRIQAGGRSVAVRIPIEALNGPLEAVVRLRSESDGSSDVRVSVPRPSGSFVGEPLVFRAIRGGAFQTVAALEFQRSERLRIEWPIVAATDRREVRLLDRTGKALPVGVALTETQASGAPVLAGDLALGPLAAGDFVIEIVAGAAERSDRKLVAFRVR